MDIETLVIEFKLNPTIGEVLYDRIFIDKVFEEALVVKYVRWCFWKSLSPYISVPDTVELLNKIKITFEDTKPDKQYKDI